MSILFVADPIDYPKARPIHPFKFAFIKKLTDLSESTNYQNNFIFPSNITIPSSKSEISF